MSKRKKLTVDTTMSSDISSTTMQSWRSRPASSYSFKVNILSQFESSTLHSDGKYQTRYFSSGGYKWRMVIYPEGNEKDNGNGFISMYVEIDSTSLVSTSSNEVHADIKFFIFNKIENKYFTIQDVEPKPFNTFKTVWGLPQVLPLDTFNDHKNGYIFNGDHSEFGVDVIVAPPPTKWEVLSFDVNPRYHKFSWIVKNFSEIKENPHKSNNFSMGGVKWVLKLYPKGYPIEDNKWLSFYLSLTDSTILKEHERVYVKAHLNVQNPTGSNHLTHELNWWFDKPGKGAGRDHYVSIADLQKSYLDKEGTLKVEAVFEVVSTTKYSTIT